MWLLQFSVSHRRRYDVSDSALGTYNSQSDNAYMARLPVSVFLFDFWNMKICFYLDQIYVTHSARQTCPISAKLEVLDMGNFSWSPALTHQHDTATQCIKQYGTFSYYIQEKVPIGKSTNMVLFPKEKGREGKLDTESPLFKVCFYAYCPSFCWLAIEIESLYDV